MANNILNSTKTEVTTLAMCWKLKLRNKKVLGFTNHDKDIVIDDVLYIADSGFTSSAVASNSDLSVDNLDIQGIISNSIISEDDILSGLYDHAEIEVFMTDYLNPHTGIIKLRKGWFGEVKLSSSHFIVEVRGLLQSLDATIGELYSPNCRACLGDSQCCVDTELYRINDLHVTEIIDDQSFLFKANTQSEAKIQNNKMYLYGTVLFHTGKNAGHSIEIQYCDHQRICIMLPLPHAVSIHDAFSILPGCDKNISTCINTYKNAINFRGEPHIPSATKIKNNN